MVPLPFGRGVFLYGDPIRVPRDAGDEGQERARLLLESELRRLTSEADEMVAGGGES